MNRISIPTLSIMRLGELVVPSHATVESMIKPGNYRSVHENINSANFPIINCGPLQGYLACFSREVTEGEVRQEVEVIGKKFAPSIGYLLAVSAHPKHSKLQMPILCPGSCIVVDDTRCFPWLHGRGEARDIDLFCHFDDWVEDICRFLIVDPPASR